MGGNDIFHKFRQQRCDGKVANGLRYKLQSLDSPAASGHVHVSWLLSLFDTICFERHFFFFGVMSYVICVYLWCIQFPTMMRSVEMNKERVETSFFSHI